MSKASSIFLRWVRLTIRPTGKEIEGPEAPEGPPVSAAVADGICHHDPWKRRRMNGEKKRTPRVGRDDPKDGLIHSRVMLYKYSVVALVRLRISTIFR